MARALATRIRRLPVAIGYYRGPPIMSALRKRWLLFRNPHAEIRIGRHTRLGPGFTLQMPFGGTFIAGERCDFRRNFRAEFGRGDARIEFGDDCVCSYDTVVQCSTTLEFGDRCQIGRAIIVDGQHRFRDLDKPMLDQGYDFHEVKIEDDAVITSNCTIMASLGKRAVIGANSVVTRPIPAYTIAVGIPARPVEYFGPPKEAPAAL